MRMINRFLARHPATAEARSETTLRHVKELIRLLEKSESPGCPCCGSDQHLEDDPDIKFLYLAHKDTSKEFLDWIYESRHAICERRLLILASGKLGSGPYTAQYGNIVAEFAGWESLTIIQPVQENYSLVGSVWVGDLLDGESSLTSEDLSRLEVFMLQ